MCRTISIVVIFGHLAIQSDDSFVTDRKMNFVFSTIFILLHLHYLHQAHVEKQLNKVLLGGMIVCRLPSVYKCLIHSMSLIFNLVKRKESNRTWRKMTVRCHINCCTWEVYIKKKSEQVNDKKTNRNHQKRKSDLQNANQQLPEVLIGTLKHIGKGIQQIGNKQKEKTCHLLILKNNSFELYCMLSTI